MKKTFITVLFLLIAFCLLAQTEFDIRAFSDSTKYGWKDWRDRNAYREDLLNRQLLLQMYNGDSPIRTEVSVPIKINILKSALVPGLGQFACEANTKGSIILGSDLLAIGASVYLYDRSQYYYKKYLTATNIEDIEMYYSQAMNPRQYSLFFAGLAVIIWGYNLYDVIQTTDDYNAKVWQKIVEKYATKTVSMGPEGLKVRF